MTQSSVNSKKPSAGVRLILAAVMAMIAFVWATPAYAQFICGGSTDGSEPQGSSAASATGSSNNVACGIIANASGVGSSNTALLSAEKFAFSVNWGTFQGENGGALSGAVRIYHNMQLQGSFAYGFRENMAGGHAGLRFGF